MTLKKRFSLVLLAITTAYIAPASAVNKAPEKTTLTYAIDRKGSEIGTHSVSYDFTNDNGVSVDIEARIRVKMAFITVFKMDHKAQEIWRNGQLVEMTSKTRRNNDREEVALEATDDHYMLTTDEATQTAPLDLVPSSFTKTDFWIDEGQKDFMLLDTLTGLMRPSRLECHDRVKVELNGQIQDARYYRIVNLEKDALSHEFWIDDDGYLIKAHLLTKDGESLFYRFKDGVDSKAA
ncbi:hypothetical protein GCM10007972_21850 [Iodidimonas muriae]|uniref:DUF3108 domain-containing protein n=1 Tax=Iodidimonas muriae TaxID=261467 RepID=A0ABQ2LEV1_9PROT|nr:hypothetical protein JCM17843_19630 [Kordiimonadales bacterium JCM 17843]GGO14545.1 hypothetical protein GCM10007972_21850 [Iodidimonas muriae]